MALLLVEDSLRQELSWLLQRNARAHVADHSAAELHLGRELVLPVSVRVTRKRKLKPELVAQVSLRVGVPRHTPLQVIDGVRFPSAEHVVVQLCSSVHRGAISLAAELLRSGSVAEHRPIEVQQVVAQASSSGAVVARRVGFLLSRAGHERAAQQLRRRGTRSRLELGSPPGGYFDRHWGLDINVADGFAATSEVSALLADALLDRYGGGFQRLAVLLSLGLPLSESVLRSLSRGKELPRWADELEGAGWLAKGPSGLRPVAPTGGALLLLAKGIRRSDQKRLYDRWRQRLFSEGTGAADADAILLSEQIAPAETVELLREKLPRVLAQAQSDQLIRLADDVDLTTAPELRVQLLERLGRFDEVARAYRLRLAQATPTQRGPRLLENARVAWRRGRASEARARLAELEDLVDASDLRIEALLLGAALDIEQGRHKKAQVSLKRALELADVTGEELARARCLHRLGTIEARRGRPLDARSAYLAALDALAGVEQPPAALIGILQSNLALTALWLGRYAEARQLGGRALLEKRRSGTPAQMLSTRVLVARIDRAEGVNVVARGADTFERLALESSRLGDLRLEVEAWLDVVEQRVRQHSADDAQRALDRARAAHVKLAGAEPILTALVELHDGLVLALAGEPEAGADMLLEVAEQLLGLEASYWAVSARRDAASVLAGAGHRQTALRELRSVAGACARRGFVLGAEHEHALLYTLGALEGDASVRRHSRRCLERVTPSRLRQELLEAGHEALLVALTESSAGAPSAEAVARRTGPDGVRWISADELRRLRTGAANTIVLDALREELVLPDGSLAPLGRRRVLRPLLVTLGSSPGRAVSFSQLAQEVLERRDTPSTRSAIKMNVSRLRSLLGTWADVIELTRVEGQAGYRFAASTAFVLVERV